MSSPKVWMRYTVVLLLIPLNVVIFWIAFSPTSHLLRVSFLDVGQGDSILIQGPTGVRMLIDGGPDRSVMRELPKIMGPLQREIDVMVETHPDKDHISGLADVLESYKVNNILSPGLPSDTNVYTRLEDDVEKEPGIHSYIAHTGMRIHLGGGAYADVLYPNHDVSKLKATNDASIVLHVVYGKTSFMLTGDLPSTIEDVLVKSTPASDLKSDVLKAGHHGSKYSTDDLWLRTVSPSIAVISAGKGNTYGHPAPEVLGRIERQGSRTLSTIDQGTITLVSNGVRVVEK